MQRRHFIAVSLAALSLATFVSGSAASPAADTSDPSGFVNNFAQTGIVQVLDAKIPQKEKADRFRALFKQNFDIPAIARFTAARFWKAATPDEQTKFLAAFEDVIVYTWARRFSEYNGQTLSVQSSVPDGENGALVTSTINSKDTRPIAVAWRLRKRPEGWRIVDISVEGVSMAQSYRQEYASIVSQQGGFSGLVTQLQSQASNLAAQQ
jgi:phospholipid transport system substrate-binding protein